MLSESLLTTREAAKFLRVSAAFLERDRVESGRVPFIKLGSRSVRYRQEDLNEYVEGLLRRSTSDQSIHTKVVQKRGGR